MRIGITNLKGGVGKTTVTQNLAVCLTHMGYRTCIVDTDTNQNSLSWYAARDADLPQLTVVGATEARALNKTVDALHTDYDMVLIDGTPSLSEMTTRIIMASDLLLIPILPSGHDFRAMSQFFERFEQAREFRPNIPAYFLLNRFSEGVGIHSDIRGLLDQFGIPILNSTLRDRVAYIKTAVEGRGVYEFSDEKAKAEVVALAQEVIGLAGELGLVQQ